MQSIWQYKYMSVKVQKYGAKIASNSIILKLLIVSPID